VRRNEYRRVAYRPARDSGEPRGALHLVLRFGHRYVWPHRWPVLACIVLVSLNACSVYLQSYYGRIVVDEILVVRPARQASLDAPSPAADRTREAAATETTRSRDGALSERSRLTSEIRPPWAGRRLAAIFAIYLFTIVALNLADRATQFIRSRVAVRITARLREDIHGKIVGLSTSYHLAHSPGRLMSRILADVGVVQDRLMELVVTATSQVLMFLTGLVILVVLDWRVAVAVVLAMVPYTAIVSRVRAEVRRTNREIRHTNACLWGLVAQKLDAMRAIVAYGRERAERLHFHRLSAVLLRDTIYQQRLGAGMNRAADIISLLTVRGIFLTCTTVVLAGGMTLGQMMYIYGAAMSLFVPVVQLTQVALHLSSLLVILQRLAQTFETREEIAEDPHAVPFPTPVRQGIRLQEVTFAWNSEGEPVIDDLSLEIPAGRWVCIMGPSGSGKTTLLQLLARLFDPQEGTVRVDGVPLDDIRFSALRRHVAYVPQEAQILSGTVRDNIAYGRPDATPTQIMAAALAAECHDFIMDLPVKYETVVGEKGTTLSGGQRQRLSIARALLTDPDVLLLDDCLSALDAETERRLQETLARLLAGRTAVIVSQRVSMAMRCHRIVVLKDGRVVEQGTPDALLSRGGYYATLHEQQMGAG
jgi:ABC-type multidrug transport system fused ATPase/permease subunit